MVVMGFCLLAGQAGAADLQVRLFSVDGNLCSPGDSVSVYAQEIVIEVSLVNWNWNYGTDVLYGVSMNMNLGTGQDLVTLDCNDIEYNLDAFSSGTCFCGVATANEKFDITVANPVCAGNTLPLWLYRQKMYVTGFYGTLTITVSADAGVDYGLWHAANGCIEPIVQDRTVGNGILELAFSGAPPTRTITPHIVTVNPPESVQFEVGGWQSCGWDPPLLVFSDTCTHGDVDNATGLFTTVATRYETCEVSVFDNAYPEACSEAGADCTASVIIRSACLADCNGDGKVNLTDLGKLKSEFGRTNCNLEDPGFCCKADTNSDGKVNLTDLGNLKAEFGKTNCSIVTPPCTF
jgi:hypothetical protein